jgi:hypothetical protein
VDGTVTVEAGAAIVAAYAHGSGGSGTSGLDVVGNVAVNPGGTAILGCEASAFPCIDDNQTSPTLASHDTVGGSVIATNPLGIVIHATTIAGDATQSGGGGGVTCAPAGVFTTLTPPSGAFTDYEDDVIHGNLRVSGLATCWDGAIRDTIGGSATFSDNTMADPDASEVVSNQIDGNLVCAGNSPSIQFGDSQGSPNVVAGFTSGQCAFGVTRANPAPAGPQTPISVPTSALPGYWLVARDGGVFSFGVPFFGSQGGRRLSAPIVAMAPVPGGASYSLAGSDGAVYGQGPAATECVGGSRTLNKPIVGMAETPGGNGCWLAASDGGIFSIGTQAHFYGSAGSLRLNKPIVGVAAAPDGHGYYLVASDGGVFTYGTGAHFHGSMGGRPLNQPIVGIAVDPTTGGYWLVAKDGGIFSFDAPFLGSLGSKRLNQPIVGMAGAPTGTGYYLVAADGGIFTFGPGAHFQGSTGSLHLSQPIVGMALG